jgi:hypothetical protein
MEFSRVNCSTNECSGTVEPNEEANLKNPELMEDENLVEQEAGSMPPTASQTVDSPLQRLFERQKL